MKYLPTKQLVLGIAVLLSVLANAQNDCWDDFWNIYSFDDGAGMECLFIDTVSNPNNIWQIGSPQKNTFTSADSAPNAIVTDTLNPYPINDTSSFEISFIADKIHLYNYPLSASLTVDYKVNSDSLNDFGLMEFSPDNGNTWFDMLIGNNGAFLYYMAAPPVLTGESNGWWESSWVLISSQTSQYQIETGDTVKFRFTFITDSIADSLDGLMFDNIDVSNFAEWYIGLDEYDINQITSKAYPNPAMDKVTIEFNNPNQSPYELKVVNNLGEEVLKRTGIKENEVLLDLSKVEPGFYTYYLQSLTRESWSTGTIIKAR